MKIRNGFVSNSSTSSFCIFGAAIEKGEFIEKIRELNPKLDAKYEALENGEVLTDKYESGEEYEVDESELDEEALEIAEEYLAKKGLDLESGNYEGDDYYIGRCWTSIKDNETGKRFKNSIRKSVKALFPKAKCETIEETYQS